MIALWPLSYRGMALTPLKLALLRWIHEQAEGDRSIVVDVAHWASAARRDEQSLYSLVQELEEDHYVEQELSYNLLECSLSLAGLEEVEKSLARRADWPSRTDYTRTALVKWLYRYYLAGRQPADVARFCRSPAGFFEGEPISSGEAGRAVIYLADNGLVEYDDQWNQGIIFPKLTSRGVDCAERRIKVSEFLNSSEPQPGPTFHIHMTDPQGVIIGAQSGFTQNNTAGLDVTQLTHFAGLARQSLPALGLDAERQATAEGQAEALHAEASSPAPDRSRLRRFADGLIATLAPSAGTALGQVVLEAGNQAVAALS